MNPVLRNILSVVAGLIAGSIVNMGIIIISGSIIPPPEGVDVSSMESIKNNMHLYEPRHFIMPFLAHALGTLFGALVATLIAATHKMKFALLIGLLFLIGGIINIISLPSPLWFTILDLALAYFPMAWIGSRMAGGKIGQ